MKLMISHIIIPAIMPINFFMIAFMPIEVLGCRMRGLFAVLIAFMSGLAALGTAVLALRGRVRRDRNAIWWMGSTLVLTIPVVALLVMA